MSCDNCDDDGSPKHLIDGCKCSCHVRPVKVKTNCPNCADNHRNDNITERAFICSCSCHSWSGFFKVPDVGLITEVIQVREGEKIALVGFKLEELKALGRILENQYIAYDDSEAHEVVNKIFRILRGNNANPKVP